MPNFESYLKRAHTTSGSKTDKVEVSKFKVFVGKLVNAHFVEQCPINLECKVVHILDLSSDFTIIGNIEETRVSENFLIGRKLDVDKVKPFAHISSLSIQHHIMGKIIAGTTLPS